MQPLPKALLATEVVVGLLPKEANATVNNLKSKDLPLAVTVVNVYFSSRDELPTVG